MSLSPYTRPQWRKLAQIRLLGSRWTFTAFYWPFGTWGRPAIGREPWGQLYAFLGPLSIALWPDVELEK
jgi:hypothetical protein